MPRRVLTSYTRARRAVIACLGDSLTFNHTLGVAPEAFWPELLAASLRGLGATPKARNFGRSGQTTDQMVARQAVLTVNDIPDLAVLWGGVNDMAGACAASQGGAGNVNVGAHDYVVAHVTAAGESPAAYHRTLTVTSSASQVSLTSIPLGVTGTTARKVYRSKAGTTTPLFLLTTIADNTTTTYTDNTADSSLPATQPPTVPSTQANLATMITAVLAAGCPRVVVLNTQYQNYSSGGDTTVTPFAPYATLRGYQAAAVTAAGNAQVVLCDLYAAMRALIVGGQETQGSFSWHVADSNQHLNALGNRYVRDSVLATIQAQAGWVAALTKL